MLTLKVEKIDASTLKDGLFATPGGGKFDIPSVDSLLSGKIGTDNAILDVQVRFVQLLSSFWLIWLFINQIALYNHAFSVVIGIIVSVICAHLPLPQG